MGVAINARAGESLRQLHPRTLTGRRIDALEARIRELQVVMRRGMEDIEHVRPEDLREANIATRARLDGYNSALVAVQGFLAAALADEEE